LVDELKKRGFIINKSQISMKPIKSEGEFVASIRLRHGLEANINIIVST